MIEEDWNPPAPSTHKRFPVLIQGKNAYVEIEIKTEKTVCELPQIEIRIRAPHGEMPDITLLCTPGDIRELVLALCIQGDYCSRQLPPYGVPLFCDNDGDPFCPGDRRGINE